MTIMPMAEGREREKSSLPIPSVPRWWVVCSTKCRWEEPSFIQRNQLPSCSENLSVSTISLQRPHINSLDLCIGTGKKLLLGWISKQGEIRHLFWCRWCFSYWKDRVFESNYRLLYSFHHCLHCQLFSKDFCNVAKSFSVCIKFSSKLLLISTPSTYEILMIVPLLLT